MDTDSRADLARTIWKTMTGSTDLQWAELVKLPMNDLKREPIHRAFAAADTALSKIRSHLEKDKPKASEQSISAPLRLVVPSAPQAPAPT